LLRDAPSARHIHATESTLPKSAPVSGYFSSSVSARTSSTSVFA
jgi:hypothetical protein